MTLHVEALFSHDGYGRLVRVNEPNGAPAPRLFVGKTADGCVTRVRSDVSSARRRELEAIASSSALMETAWDEAIDPAPYCARLEIDVPVQRIWVGPAFSFPAHVSRSDARHVSVDDIELLRRYFEGWIGYVLAGCPLFAAVIDDSAVAVCCSVRQTALAHEAGVETAEAFRRRGYAAAAASAWARDVRDRGFVPLYSTSWNNTASRGVARKLNLAQFGSDLHIV